MAALEKGGLEPDIFMKEYGANQFEVTNGPDHGVRSADSAVILREVTRMTAKRLGEEVTITPIRDPEGVGNACISTSAFWTRTASQSLTTKMAWPACHRSPPPSLLVC